MKNIYRLFIIILLMLPILVNATCNDEELNEWATNVKVTFTRSDELNADELGYAYFLSIAPLRDDVYIKVTDVDGDAVEVKHYHSEEEYLDDTEFKTRTKFDFYAAGCYTNLEEETYTIKVYGGENSKCKNELLKTLEYTVPRYNRMTSNAICEKYPDHELCQTFTNKTENMTEEEFKKAMNNYDKKEEGSIITKDDIISKILNYSLFVIVPFIIITIVYLNKRRKFKKEREIE